MAAIGLTIVGLESVLAFSAAPRSHLHRSNRRVSVAVDCYPTNPRGYFDLDLRDSATRRRLEAEKVRDLADCSAAAPYAIELQYNRLQFRDVDPPERREGVRRVAALGDSFTEGQGVKQPDIWARRLEARLDAVEPGGWEVLNFGRRGADFPALRDNFERLLAYEPDVTVYGMMLNDAARSESFEMRTTELAAHVTASEAPASASRLLDLFKRRVETLETARRTTSWYNDLYSRANTAGWRQTQRHLLEMDQAMKRRRGRFIVMLWPVLAGLERGYPFEQAHAEIAAFCHRAGIEFQDLLPAFRGRETERLWVHGVDKHPNEIAHELAAAGLQPVVIEGESRLQSAPGLTPATRIHPRAHDPVQVVSTARRRAVEGVRSVSPSASRSRQLVPSAMAGG